MPSAERAGAPVPSAAGEVRVDAHRRQDLREGWQAASCPPGSRSGVDEIAELDWIAAAVPGTAAGALREAGMDYLGGRDLDAEDWWFRTGFEASPAEPDEVVLLRLDGIATFHEVFLNGERIGGGESMFAPAAIEVGGKLREGVNELAIHCQALASRLGERRKPRARWRAMLADNRLRFHRTMLLGRCPGFAPGPAAVGPWRPVWIERRRVLELTDLTLRTRLEGEDGVLSVAATVRGIGGFEVTAADAVLTDASEVEAALAVEPGEDGAVALRGEVRVPAARRWWPHTHGEPALHAVRLRVAGPEGEVGIDAGRVGFRELAPGPEPDHDVLRDGLDLRLNGVPVFARGAVWTPVDFVAMAADRAGLRAALERVRDAGMNMVRLQGTGAYESPEFHDLCDELGILVWQDLMFANFDYPFEDEGFRAAAEAEASERLAALGWRPSVVVWCGNSEVEQQVSMLGFDPQLGQFDFFLRDLPEALRAAEVDAIYLRSAPCGGDLPFRLDRGVANYFGVGGYLRPLSDARLADVRFAAECLAFGNVPDPAGVEAIAPGERDLFVHEARWKAGTPRDAGAGWDFDDVRDHYLRELFGVDPLALRSQDHERYLELSRVVSGEAMAATFGEWRRGGSSCAGGLVLWLRDLLPGAGWGLFDHSGAAKQALRDLAPIFAPTAVWMTDEGLDGIGVHVANDGPERLEANLRVALYVDGERQVGEARERVDLDPHTTVGQDLEAILGSFRDVSWVYRFGPPAQDVIFASLETDAADGASRPLAQATFLPVARPREALHADFLGLEAEARAEDDGIVVRLRSERFVHRVGLLAEGRRLEGSAFSLEPRVERIVRLPGSGVGSLRVTAQNLAGSLGVTVEGTS